MTTILFWFVLIGASAFILLCFFLMVYENPWPWSL